MALVVEDKEPKTGQSRILGIGRLRKLHGSNDGEFAVLVSDEYQGQGLGAELVRRLIEVARDEKLSKIVGDILPDNTVMRRVCEKLGFALQGEPDEQILKAEMTL